MASAMQLLSPQSAVVTLLTVILELPGCSSLKEKRGRLAAIINRIQKEFNVSVAETDYQDAWQSAVLSCVIVSNDAPHNSRVLNNILRYLESHYPDEPVVESHQGNR